MFKTTDRFQQTFPCAAIEMMPAGAQQFFGFRNLNAITQPRMAANPRAVFAQRTLHFAHRHGDGVFRNTHTIPSLANHLFVIEMEARVRDQGFQKTQCLGAQLDQLFVAPEAVRTEIEREGTERQKLASRGHRHC
ncbi:MAG: hypothetical protein WDO18_16720 [Acidobacteriota bacterium]